MVRRIGIYVFYDSKGLVGKYVEKLLTDLSVVFNKLIIVVNGKIEKKELIKLIL